MLCVACVPMFGLCLFCKVCRPLLVHEPGSDEAAGRGHADCKSGMWMHHWPPIITFTKSSPNVCFNLQGAGQHTIILGGGGLFNESGKTNLETDKRMSLFGEMVSSLRDRGAITELCYRFCSPLQMPSLAKNLLCINYWLWMHAN